MTDAGQPPPVPARPTPPTGGTGDTGGTGRAGGAGGTAANLDPNRWRILALLGSIQFMLLLDATVVSVALPPIQRDLGFTQEGLSWVLNAYVLSAGGFLLLGGRLADVFGRRRMFLVGMVAFGLGSLFAALAWQPAVLIGARFVQGFGEAFAAPAALGIIAVLFSDPFERIRALSIWAGLAGAGGAAGSVVGGFVTSFASWHWLFIINIPIAVAAFLGVFRLVKRIPGDARQPLDVGGAITSTAAIGLVMVGVLQAVHVDVSSPRVIVPIVAGILSAVAFIFIEIRVPAPLIPKGFFSEPVRRASNVLAALGAAVFASYPFTMTLYAQNVLGYTPLMVGFMLLPLIAALGLGLVLGSRLLKSRTIKEIAIGTGVIAAAGLTWTSFVQVDSQYVPHILPGMVLFGLAIGLAMPVLTNGALFGTTPANSSLASAIQTAAQQAGSALGLAIFAATATAVTIRLAADGTGVDAAATAGYAVALRLGAGVSLTSSVAAAILLPNIRASDDRATAGVQPGA
ncbi:MAG TPA: MFS transporter [Actinomycetaceae bacterium]|nr:MFS transporter [Actinomycetaceae bacterium]